MKVFIVIVYAHAEPRSFNGALFQRAQKRRYALPVIP
jgi:putative NADPH-quinone reductase